MILKNSRLKFTITCHINYIILLNPSFFRNSFVLFLFSKFKTVIIVSLIKSHLDNLELNDLYNSLSRKCKNNVQTHTNHEHITLEIQSIRKIMT